MAKPRDNRQKDLLRPALEDIIDLAHPLVRLAREIDFARPVPGARHNIAGCSLGLKTGAQPFFTGDSVKALDAVSMGALRS